jgi:hypothetical protein
MRALIVIMCAMAIGCASMQQISETERTFERVVEVPGMPQEQIYEGIKIWIANNFKSSKAVIEYDNKESGTVIGNGIIKYPCKGIECVAKNDWTVPFTMRADTKDGKFRLTFTNLKLSWPPSASGGHFTSGHEGPISTKADIDKVRPVLAAFGDEIKSSLGKETIKKDW